MSRAQTSFCKALQQTETFETAEHAREQYNRYTMIVQNWISICMIRSLFQKLAPLGELDLRLVLAAYERIGR